MMREILFKAKGKEGEGWKEGSYWRTQNTTYCFLEDYKKDPENTHHFILFDSMTDWGLPNKKFRMDIDPETLCQYTGLTDINGKKIWENDIVTFSDTYSTENGYVESNCIGKVVWDEETLSFQVTGRLSAESYEVLQECCVIGNIFDNAELLKKG